MFKKINKKFLVVVNGKKFIFESLQDAMKFVASYNISGKGI